MRPAGNFNPEWGYIAPAPNFPAHSARFVVAAAIGATASAAVVFSLMDRPAAETSVAARTLVQVVPARSAPLVAQVQPQSEQTSAPAGTAFCLAGTAGGCGRRTPAARRGRGRAHGCEFCRRCRVNDAASADRCRARRSSENNNDDGSAACTRSRE